MSYKESAVPVLNR